MRIVANNSGEYPDVINSYYDLERYDTNSTTQVLFQGYETSINAALKEKFIPYSRRVYLNLEAPCAFTSRQDAITSQNFFTEVYTICPYTANWLNTSDQTNTRYIPIAFPFRDVCFNNLNKTNKPFTSMYMGNAFADMHKSIIEAMKKAGIYIFCSLTPNFYATHVNVASQKKWELLSQSKTSIATNILPLNAQHVEVIKSYKDWENNEAFKHIDKHIAPQFKPRIIEAALCKSINLVKKDPWNVIEYWFEPGIDFLYWETSEELEHLIKDISSNYDKYKHVIDCAYNKVQHYSIDKIMEEIIDGVYL